MASVRRSSGSQSLDVFQFHPQGLFVEKNHRIKGLILRAGGNILPGEMRPFQFLFTRQIMGKPPDVVAVSPEPGAVAALRCERKMLPANNFPNSANCFVNVHPGT